MANAVWKSVRTAGVTVRRFRTSNARRGYAYSCNEFNGTVFSVIRSYSNLNGNIYGFVSI
jgi:hypothetical protein